jgi:hypothetical protein
MALGDLQDLNVDMLMRVTTNGGTDVVLDQAAEDGSSAGPYVFGVQAPAITTVDLNGAGPLMPAANGPERYRVRIERVA